MVSRAAPTLPADLWKYIFHYLDFHGQQRCARVCRQWNIFLHELQYEYGRCQALSLGRIGPLNLPVTEKVQFSVHGWRGHYILFSKVDQQVSSLWFRDLRSQESQEVWQDPRASLTNLFAVRWISPERFVTVSDAPSEQFYQVIVWRISQEKDLYQITRVAQQFFNKKSMIIKNVLSLENQILVNFEDPRRSHASESSAQYQMIIGVDKTGLKVKNVDPLLRTHQQFFTDGCQRVFALKDSNIKAYDLKDEKTSRLAWQIEFLYSQIYSPIYPMKVEANDRWFITRSIKRDINDNPTRVMLQVVDSSIGNDVVLVPLNTTLTPIHEPFWLDGDFLLSQQGAYLQIIHIPTHRKLESTFVCDLRKLTTPLAVKDRSPIHRAYFDQDTLRIVYEDAKGLQVHTVKLEKHQPLWAQSNRWKAVKIFFGSLMAFPRRFWQWLRTLLFGN
jgi:hypothetical protein